MYYDILMFIHLTTVVPCIFLGAYVLLAKKGTAAHRKMALLYFGAIIIAGGFTLAPGRYLNELFWINALTTNRTLVLNLVLSALFRL